MLQGGLPAIALHSALAYNTAYCNDVSAELVYAQAVLSLGKEGDVLLAITTSGNSKNVIYAAKTAKAKGVAGSKIIFGHALKNSLIPVITYLGPMLAYIVTGSLVVEQIFAVPGIGRYFVSSITGRDYPLIMGTTIVLACLIVIMNLVSDIMYKVVDPRITLE